jgi:hypothetical protein
VLRQQSYLNKQIKKTQKQINKQKERKDERKFSNIEFDSQTNKRTVRIKRLVMDKKYIKTNKPTDTTHEQFGKINTLVNNRFYRVILKDRKYNSVSKCNKHTKIFK